jgi:hypothetical protein
MRDNDELDQMIDAALATYGNISAGESFDPLEERVLRRVQRRRVAEERRALRRRLVPWAAAFALAACAAAWMVVHPKPVRVPRDETRQTKQHEPTTAVSKVRVPTLEMSHKPATGRSAEHATKFESRYGPPSTPSLPKLDVFPAPHAPTEEEATLSFFIQRAPASEVEDLLRTQASLDVPITIDELEIPPIAPLNVDGR